MNSKCPRVLIGSPIRQEPEILSWFLHSLSCLDTEDVRVDFFFVDDNDNAVSSALIEAFSVGRNVLRHVGESVGPSYHKDEQTHHWKEELIWKVARYKDRIIRFAVDNDYDYLFLIDSDLVLHPSTLQNLISSSKPIVSEIFWTQRRPDQPELPQVWLRDAYSGQIDHRFRSKPTTDSDPNRPVVPVQSDRVTGAA